MRFYVFWIAVEMLQVAALAALVITCRDLKRRLDRQDRFETRPPRSVTED